MTDHASSYRPRSVSEAGSDSTHQWALQTASTVKNRWRSGAPPNLTAVLDSYPELKNHKTIVVELAYEEYCLRLKAGESLDVEQFARRFHPFGRAVYLNIMAQSYARNDPDFVALQDSIAWPKPGDHFLGFDLISELGRGAVGRVFLASERKLGERRVVVKISMHGSREADIMGRLQHANIVPINSIDVDDTTGLTAFCMRYLGQATLADVLDAMYADHRPPIQARAILDAIASANQAADPPESPPPDRILHRGSYAEGVIYLAMKLAEALSHAHAHGIFHRDLKPSNILMSPDGQPLLLDFNLSVDDRHPTGGVGGTVPYMAPEELSTLCEMPGGEDLPRFDPRSDLFSLGVILYETLTGVLPFDATLCNGTVEEVVIQLQEQRKAGPRPIREHNRRVDKRLARLVDRCLAYDPQDRPGNADALAAALRKELTLARRTGRWLVAHRRLVLAAASAAITLLLGITAFFILRPPYRVRQFQQALAHYKAGEDYLALDCVNTSLRIDPRWTEALTARARIYERQGDFQLAFADYQAAGRMSPGPRIEACKGYCLNQLAHDQEAAVCYRRSLLTGYESPAVLNNLGYSCLRLRQFEESKAYLQRALRADDQLQAAHHNLVLVFLQWGYEGKAIPSEAFVHARRKLADAALQEIKIKYGVRHAEDNVAAEDDAEPLAGDPEILALIEQEYDPKNRVSVPETLRSPHPVVENTRVALNKSHDDRYGLVHAWGADEGVLTLAVTKATMNRALRIANTLLKAFESRGYKVQTVRCEGGRRLKLEALGEAVQIHLREKTSRLERSTAEREKARSWERYDYMPTGRLELKLELPDSPVERVWVDGKRAKLDDDVQDILIGLLILIDKARTRQKELEEWTRNYRAKQQQKLEAEQRSRAEQVRYEELEKLAAAWSLSRRLRDFLAAVRDDVRRRGQDLSANPKLAAWLAWAERYADSLDPLADESPLFNKMQVATEAQETAEEGVEGEVPWTPPRQPR